MASSSKKTAVSKFMPTGYDYEFVDEVRGELICSICFHPMLMPVQTKCGHRFCKGCLQEAHKRKKPPQCPEDRQELRKQDVFEDKATERLIQSLAIKCPSDGCQWSGELRDFEKNHTCTPTSRELKSGQKVKEDKIPSNLTEEDSLTSVPCVYQRFGCKVKTPRKDMDKHIASKIGHHLNITSERLMLLENENLQLKTRQMEVERQYQNLKTSFAKEKDETKTNAKEISNLQTNMEQKWVRLDKSLQTLNSQKGEFSKEIKNLRKQMKQQVNEQTKTDPKSAVNTAAINKNKTEKIERSRLRIETSIDELNREFKNKMKKTIDQLQQELDEQTRRIRNQMPKCNFDSHRTCRKKMNKNQTAAEHSEFHLEPVKKAFIYIFIYLIFIVCAVCYFLPYLT